MMTILTGIANFRNLIIAGIVATLIGGAFLYHRTMQNRIQTLVESNEQLIRSNAIWEQSFNRVVDINKENDEILKKAQEQERLVRENYEKIQDEFQIIRMQNKEFRERLGNRNLSALAAEKTETVETIINEASNKALRCFELQSGAPFTDREKNARSAIDANSECPWIFDEMFSNE